MSTISYRITRVRCPDCEGTGKIPKASHVECPVCLGRGKATQNDLLFWADTVEACLPWYSQDDRFTQGERVKRLRALAEQLDDRGSIRFQGSPILLSTPSAPTRRWPD